MKTFDLIEYDREDFAEFLYDFLPDDFESINDEIYGEYKNINSGYHLGSCKSLDLDIFEFETNKNLDARVSLTREVCAVMKKYGFNPNALIIFYSNDSDKYRLSLITTDYKSENNKIKAEYSNPRRFSFKLGKDCKRHTPEQMLFTKGPVKSIEDLKSRFSVESISDAFFEQYKVFYEDFVQFITGNRYLKKDNKWIKTPIHKPNKEIYEEFLRISNNDEELAQKYVRDYIKKMMGRLVFLQFLQKKGWLGVEQNELWGTGDKSYLQKLFETTDFKDDFLEKVLEPLFFKTLNQKRDGDIAQKILQLDSKTKVKIPYLNGGLFEEDILDKIKISFPKELFSNTKKRDFQRVFNGKTETQYDYTNAQGLLDFFAQYNFTIDETDPTETELGVDPEMLGKIFENLLEDNKDKGAFYTPKEIVQYMCQESLIAYLSSNTSHCEAQSDEAISFENRIRDFVKNPHNPHYFTEEQKTLILQKLKDVKVCDPAIGSGAFPMGMMNILYACRSELESENDICEIKKQIVKNNIYGVDIEKGAVDIARLRFWLSIIVDETEPIPLPNLDYKLMQGNSLIESFEGVDLSMITKTASEELFDNEETLKKLQAALEGYYIPDNTIAKDKIRNQIKTNVITLMKDRQLAPHAIEKLADENFKLHENSEFFLWHTWFNDVFNRSNNCDAPRHCERSEAIYSGFDIVIGNPPYGAKLKESDKNVFKKNFQTAKTIKNVQKGSMDSYTLFIEQGFNLIKKKGNLAYIIPISITSSDAVSGVHKLLFDNCENIKISSYAVRPQPVFEHAVVDTSILFFTKTNSSCKNLYSTKMHRKGRGFTLQDLIDNLEFAEVLKYKKFGRIPKISKKIEQDILHKILNNRTVNDYLYEQGNELFYRAAGGRYFKVITPYTNNSSAEKIIKIKGKYLSSIACILSSSLSFWFYQIYSDNHNWKACEITSLPIPNLTDDNIKRLEKLYGEYLDDIESNAMVQKSSGNSSYKVSEFKVYKIGKSKSIIDKIDNLICPLYGLSNEETEFIKNYEIEFRLSDEE